MHRLYVALTAILAAAVSSAGWACESATDDVGAAGLASFIDGAISAEMEDSRTPGVAIAVVRNGCTIVQRGYGYADAERGQRVDAALTLFRIGSISKLFTYTAAMQLVEQGRFELDRDINEYLATTPIRPAFGVPVTAHDLMAHRAGFEDGTMYRLWLPEEPMPSAQEFVGDHQSARVRPPGVATSYSNFGVSALGLAIANVADVPYASYIEEHVFKPLRMQRSSVKEPPVRGRKQPFGSMAPHLVPHASVGYRSSGGVNRPVAYEHIYPAAAPAGSSFSTASDMARFMTAYLEDGSIDTGRILRAETVQRMRTRRYTDRSSTTDYAHGFQHGTIGGHESYSHNGTMEGFRATLALIPELRLGIFVVGNSSAWDASPDIVRLIVAHAFPRQAAAQPPANEHRAHGSLAEYAGDYLTSRRSYTKLEAMLALHKSIAQVRVAGDGMLSIRMPNDLRHWVEVAPLVVRDAGGEQTIAFERNSSGKVVRFYSPGGHLFFQRMPWWQTPTFLWVALLATATAAAARIAFTLGTHRMTAARQPSPHNLAAIAIGVIGLAASALFLRAWHELASGVSVERWPPASLIHLVCASYALGVAAIAAAFLAAAAWHGRRSRWDIAAHAVCFIAFAAFVFALSRWGIFGATYN